MASGREASEQVQDAKLRLRIAQKLREARTRAGLTQADVAELIGVSQPFYTRIELARQLPGYGNLVSLCRALGLSADELLETATRPNRGPLELAVRQNYTGFGDTAPLRRLVRKLGALQSDELAALTKVADSLLRLRRRLDRLERHLHSEGEAEPPRTKKDVGAD